MEKQRTIKGDISFIVFLRIIAAMAVVIIHTKTLTNFDTKGYYFLHSCILWCVPVFFMITGYIFLGIKRNITYSHIKKYIIRSVAVLFTVGWFYAFIQRVFEEQAITVYTFVHSFIDVIKGNLWDHMWYMYSIIGIYLILPVLSTFVGSSRRNLYILTLICGIFDIVFKDISPMLKVGFTFPLSDYCFYVLLGGVLCKMEERISKKFFIPSVLILISTVIGLAIVFFLFDKNIKQSYSAIYVAVMAIAIFIICKNIFANMRVNAFADSLSKCSFGIYLVHPFFIHLFNKLFGINIEAYNQFVAFPISCLIVFVISYLATVVLRKVPLISKIL